MKKVTLIVPDHIDVLKNARSGGSSQAALNATNLLKVLCDRSDYHESYCFKDAFAIKIVSIEEHRG